MKFKANSVSKSTLDNGAIEIRLVATDRQNVIYGFTSIKDLKELSVEIKKWREKRSLSANGLLWKMCYEIGCVINRSKDDVYESMIERYGVFTHIAVKENAVEMFKQQYKLVREIGGCKVNGKDGIQLQCYFGSSNYDTKQFSHLLDGVLNEAKDLDIETITPQEKALLMENYEVTK